ncbi:MAG: RtcB family protein [Gammaproteobacteria bacterium]
MTHVNYQVIKEADGVPVKAWTRGVPFEEAAKRQLLNIAGLPFIYKWIAAMPDVHLGKGATIGSVVATTRAIIPAAVGVDIGCGMMAVKTALGTEQLPDNMSGVRSAIEMAVPHGRSKRLRKSMRDVGAWDDLPDDVIAAWAPLAEQFGRLTEKHGVLKNTHHINHLGTLGTGNHFIEICLDQDQTVWVMLHSGSRGIGNRIGSHFIELAKREMERWHIHLPDRDLAYLPEGSDHFDDYVEAVAWAQQFARINREVMMARVLKALRQSLKLEFEARIEAVNCHHNYISKEWHYGQEVLVTRKGAVRAGLGEMGIIPGSMGAKSYIVRGLGNAESFHSCSHGAGRVMSRTQAKKSVTLEQHEAATAGIECRKDKSVIDETPAAYKDIDSVMAAQQDLVDIVYTLKQVVCVKG